MIEQRLKKHSAHKYIHADARTHSSLLEEAVVCSGAGARLQRDPTEAEQTNRGGPGPREMIEPSGEGEKLQTTSRMKR